MYIISSNGAIMFYLTRYIDSWKWKAVWNFNGYFVFIWIGTIPNIRGSPHVRKEAHLSFTQQDHGEHFTLHQIRRKSSGLLPTWHQQYSAHATRRFLGIPSEWLGSWLLVTGGWWYLAGKGAKFTSYVKYIKVLNKPPIIEALFPFYIRWNIVIAPTAL